MYFHAWVTDVLEIVLAFAIRPILIISIMNDIIVMHNISIIVIFVIITISVVVIIISISVMISLLLQFLFLFFI